MTEAIPAAGYDARVVRAWIIPQGADTHNALRPFYWDESDPPEKAYYDLSQSGWSARAQIRDSVGGEQWVEFLSTAATGPRIELDAEGWVNVILPAATTEAPAWNDRLQGVYDVELTTPDGEVIRIAKGRVSVKADVTRSTDA